MQLSVTYCQISTPPPFPSALQGSLLEYMQECRPTAFLGVPRVWEKIMEGMRAKAKDVKGLKKKIRSEEREAKMILSVSYESSNKTSA